MLVVPGEQAEHEAVDVPSDAAPYNPAIHWLQLVLPFVEYHPAGQESHANAPDVYTYFPALHNEHNIVPVSAANVPGLQRYALLSPGQKPPGGQEVQVVAVSANVPPAQSDVHVDDPAAAVEQ